MKKAPHVAMRGFFSMGLPRQAVSNQRDQIFHFSSSFSGRRLS